MDGQATILNSSTSLRPGDSDRREGWIHSKSSRYHLMSIQALIMILGLILILTLIAIVIYKLSV